MALIEHLATGARHPLAASHRVGRWPGCDLRLDAPYVSGEHAAFRWRDGAWELRDLGSRNGTFVDGRRLAVAERALLGKGQRVAFGHGEDVWAIVDDGAPVLMATCLQTGSVVHADGTVLALPDANLPELTVYEMPPGCWSAERDGTTTTVGDRTVLQAGGLDWRLYLPVLQDDTTSVRLSKVLLLGDLRLLFRLSLDEEYVELRALAGARTFDLGSRAFHAVLLDLARARREDQADVSLPATAHGWVYKDDLLRRVGIAESLLNLHIFHARREFARLGVADAAGIVERRAATRQLRIGVAEHDFERI